MFTHRIVAVASLMACIGTAALAAPSTPQAQASAAPAAACTWQVEQFGFQNVPGKQKIDLAGLSDTGRIIANNNMSVDRNATYVSSGAVVENIAALLPAELRRSTALFISRNGRHVLGSASDGQHVSKPFYWIYSDEGGMVVLEEDPTLLPGGQRAEFTFFGITDEGVAYGHAIYRDRRGTNTYPYHIVSSIGSVLKPAQHENLDNSSLVQYANQTGGAITFGYQADTVKSADYASQVSRDGQWHRVRMRPTYRDDAPNDPDAYQVLALSDSGGIAGRLMHPSSEVTAFVKARPGDAPQPLRKPEGSYAAAPYFLAPSNEVAGGTAYFHDRCGVRTDPAARAFIWRKRLDGKWTSREVEVSGSCQTYPTSVNSRGDMLGSYWIPGTVRIDGQMTPFVSLQGKVTTLDQPVPGLQYAHPEPSFLNANGQVATVVREPDGTRQWPVLMTCVP